MVPLLLLSKPYVIPHISMVFHINSERIIVFIQCYYTHIHRCKHIRTCFVWYQCPFTTPFERHMV